MLRGSTIGEINALSDQTRSKPSGLRAKEYIWNTIGFRQLRIGALGGIVVPLTEKGNPPRMSPGRFSVVPWQPIDHLADGDVLNIFGGSKAISVSAICSDPKDPAPASVLTCRDGFSDCLRRIGRILQWKVVGRIFSEHTESSSVIRNTKSRLFSERIVVADVGLPAP
jgi:hypothetical protein